MSFRQRPGLPSNPGQRVYGPAGGAASVANSATSLLHPSSSPSPASSPANAGPSRSGSYRAALAEGPQRTLRPQASSSSLVSMAGTGAHSISDKFSLSPDPSLWGADLSPNHPEPDDYLHNPDPKRDRKNDNGGTFFTSRGIVNLGCVAILVVGLVTLFAGYPLIDHFTKHPLKTLGGFNLGGINATGQVPTMTGNFALIDPDTPKEAWQKKSLQDGTMWDLVFSDEFNVPNRTFYPGDDPYWEAVDLHYWATNNLEWYDPIAITTENGYLKITFDQIRNHDLDYRGGLMSSWNKFCFTGGYIEVNVTLPGANDVQGLWPAVWTMGNLGRAGYGASLEGMWPYTYDSCDVGTLANQTLNGEPATSLTHGDKYNGDVLSYQPGQRLSACTCKGAGITHPGPIKPDGTYTGRSAPEIDVFEALVKSANGEFFGQVSQSCQWAPFNDFYQVANDTGDADTVYDPTVTYFNTYIGGVFQQATSALSKTNQDCYEMSGTGCFTTYGFEYAPGNDGYVTWVNNGLPAWTIHSKALGPDPVSQISRRPVPQEPLYIIMNLGMSPNFGRISPDLVFPTSMKVDYVRVYQPPDKHNIGCDPKDFPTADYINNYIESYTNYNLTTFRDDYKQPFPKNRLIDNCE